MLKFDRSFVRDIASNAYDQAIVASIVAIARALEFRVIAEGIETDDQVERLRKLGCEVGQGYRFGRPQALNEFLELVGVRAGLRVVTAA